MVYVIMAVPTLPPVTTPPVTAATDVLLLLQVPPVMASVSVIEKVWQMGVLPFSAVGCVFTVTTCDTEQLPMI